MIAYNRIKTRLQLLIDDDSTETASEIREFVNLAYRNICARHVWQSLFTELSLASGATTLPSDLERPVLYVQDDTDYIYFPISKTDRYLTGQLFNWYPDGIIETPLVTGSDGVITANSTSFVSASPSASFTSALVGEYIQIGSNEGIYKISSVTNTTTLVLTAGFRGASETAAYYEIRPIGTPKIAYTDEQGASLTPSSAAVAWYQKRPLPLYNDYDQLLLPGNCEAVRIMAFRMLLFREKYDNDALKQDPEYQDALAMMNPLNPTTGRKVKPRDRFGSAVQYGRCKPTLRVNQNNRRILGV